VFGDFPFPQAGFLSESVILQVGEGSHLRRQSVAGVLYYGNGRLSSPKQRFP
jgi:hypothetical protein